MLNAKTCGFSTACLFLSFMYESEHLSLRIHHCTCAVSPVQDSLLKIKISKTRREGCRVLIFFQDLKIIQPSLSSYLSNYRLHKKMLLKKMYTCTFLWHHNFITVECSLTIGNIWKYKSARLSLRLFCVTLIWFARYNNDSKIMKNGWIIKCGKIICESSDSQDIMIRNFPGS